MGEFYIIRVTVTELDIVMYIMKYFVNALNITQVQEREEKQCQTRQLLFRVEQKWGGKWLH